LAYIGNTPAENYASFLTETFTVSATTNYTLSHAVTNENDIRLVINGVVQQPGSGKAYTASGTTLTLTSATVSGDVMYAVYLGRALQTVNPPNASVGTAQLASTSVTTAKVADDAITLAKMASGTDGNIISYDASGNPVAVATGNDGQVLTSTGAGSPPAFENVSVSYPLTNFSSTGIDDNASGNVMTLAGGSSTPSILFGTTATTAACRYSFRGTFYANRGIAMDSLDGSSSQVADMIWFAIQGTYNGKIAVGNSSTTYSSASDYRLKENEVPLSNGIEKIKLLKPYRFNFITNPNITRDGFFAHEVSDVVPEAVVGTKDEMETLTKVVLNSNGTIIEDKIEQADWNTGKANGKYPNNSTWVASKEVPLFQSIDPAKIVPLLTGALQESITKIETLEARITALENA